MSRHAPALLIGGLVTLLAMGCKPDPKPEPAPAPSPPKPGKLASASAPASSAELPPVDCPHHRAHAHGAGHQPFENPQDYIAHLERPDRETWQKPDAIVQALGLRGDETVVDAGAGSGYFTFRFARALPRGRVIASDVAPEMLKHIQQRARSEQVRNIETVQGEASDPKIPPGARLVFVCDVLHHVADRPAWLSNVHAQLSKGARLAIVEFKEGDLPMGPPASMKIPKSEVESLATHAGFTYLDDNAVELPYQYMVRFEKR